MFEDINPPDPKPYRRAQEASAEKLGVVKPPATADKVKHVSQASIRLIKAAIKRAPIRVSADELKRRGGICNACDLWKPSGNLGMGECTHPQCGCTKLKRGFATETCPAGKWRF